MEGADESGGTRGTRPGEAPAQEETVPSSPLSLAPKGSADANVAQGEKERGRGDTAVGTLRLYDSRDALFAEETTAALPPPRCTTAGASVSPSSCASPCAGTSGSSCSSSSPFSSLSSSYSSALGQGRATLRESLTGAAAAAAAWSRGEYQQGARGEPRLLCHPLITRCIFGPLAKARFYFRMHPSEAADAVVVLRLSDYLVSPEDAAAGGGAAEETQETCAAVDVSAVEREVLAIFRRRPQGVIVLNDLPLSCMALVRDEEGEEASAGGDRIAGGETGAAGGRGASARKNALVPFTREVFSASFFEEIAAPLGVSSSLAWTSSSASLYSAGKSRAKVKASPSARSEAHPPAASASAASRSAAGALRCGERGEGSENKGEASLSLAAAALAAAREVAREDAARQDGEFEREEERLARVAQKCSVRASLLRQNFLFEDEEEEENSDDWVDTRSDQSSPPVLLVMRRGTDLAQLAELEGIRFACVTPIPLRLGDHIYRAIKPRGILSMATHHGIYAGHGRVFHLSGNERQGVWALLANQRSAKVRVTSIRRFMGRGRSALRVKRYKEDQCDHPFTVMQRAEEAFVEQSFPSYHLLFNNCEHFAVFCKTGKGKSSQVQKAAVAAVATTSVLVGAGATAGATALAAAVLESRLRRL
ncbi:hypothetical protein BESB_083290 [Besnoitia besnoiti]|uniref:LRAT domain-containing protein n=1 Tax=Besnoitia besnoiti TaxID=94643 RepID=A0A2A9MCK7_BESBE|nr:hypothetical protein BESB_083290 [Besnoitia besnoiti]PFH33130.1 hypothetical protein BESB_083290 [Besnoitia besnoiti]